MTNLDGIILSLLLIKTLDGTILFITETFYLSIEEIFLLGIYMLTGTTSGLTGILIMDGEALIAGTLLDLEAWDGITGTPTITISIFGIESI
jgi:hypothetical protein